MKRLLIAITIPLSLTAMAQQVTYNHDAAKMNQFTVQETGLGALTPAAYYQLFHNRYQRSAQMQNKMSFRTSVGINAYQQVELAEKFDSAMINRAKIEALNMTDRQVDLAWSTEQKKIEGKLADFQRNINRIMTAGGNRGQINLWTMEYQKFQTAIKSIKESYMPNSQRKKQYLRIYNEIRQANDNLIKFLVYLNGNKQTSQLLAAQYTKPDNVGTISKASLSRWRQNSWKILPSNKPGGGIIVGPIIPWEPVFPDKPVIGPIRPPIRPPVRPPIKPIDPIKPDEPIKPVNPFDKFEPIEPDKPVIGPVSPIEPDRPIIGPVSPIEPDRPIDPNKPILGPISPINPDPKPLEPVNPDKPTIGGGLKPISPNLPEKPLVPDPSLRDPSVKPPLNNGMIMTTMVRSGTAKRSKSVVFNTINNKTKT